MFEFIDFVGLWVIIWGVYFQFSSRGYASNNRVERQWYESNRKAVGCAPPGAIFGVAWILLYGLISASIYVFARNYVGTEYYLSTLVLVTINVALNKVWSVFFWDMGESGGVGYSLLTIIVLDLTGIVVLILMGMTPAWVPLGLFLPYVAWILYATYLNWKWWRAGYKTVTPSGKMPSSPILPETIKQDACQSGFTHAVPARNYGTAIYTGARYRSPQVPMDSVRVDMTSTAQQTSVPRFGLEELPLSASVFH